MYAVDVWRKTFSEIRFIIDSKDCREGVLATCICR